MSVSVSLSVSVSVSVSVLKSVWVSVLLVSVNALVCLGLLFLRILAKHEPPYDTLLSFSCFRLLPAALLSPCSIGYDTLTRIFRRDANRTHVSRNMAHMSRMSRCSFLRSIHSSRDFSPNSRIRSCCVRRDRSHE